METEIRRIPVEGRRIDPPRNIERLWIELEAIPGNGSVVEGRLVRGVGRIEIYTDRLDRVLARVRTAEHDAIYAQAVQACEVQTRQWLENEGASHAKRMRTMTEPERKAYLALHCNIRPEHSVKLLSSYRTGLPPFRYCKVIHPQTNETMDARKWQALDQRTKAEWLIEAPMTPMNATQRANEHLANTIAKVLERRDGSNKR